MVFTVQSKVMGIRIPPNRIPNCMRSESAPSSRPGSPGRARQPWRGGNGGGQRRRSRATTSLEASPGRVPPPDRRRLERPSYSSVFRSSSSVFWAPLRSLLFSCCASQGLPRLFWIIFGERERDFCEREGSRKRCLARRRLVQKVRKWKFPQRRPPQIFLPTSGKTRDPQPLFDSHGEPG